MTPVMTRFEDIVYLEAYDLPVDFYIKVGFTLNYDNQPADDASEVDCLFQAGIGWKW